MKKIVSIITILVVLVAMSTFSYATITEDNAKINVELSKTEAKIGDQITVTVSWKDKMEAVDLILGFDKTKVKYLSSSMNPSNISASKIENGIVQVSWFTSSGDAITSITYTFEAIANGEAKFTTSEAELTDENVDSPSSYVYGSATLNIAETTGSGDTGNTGNEGNTGNTGNEGNAGNTGNEGNAGNTGDTGNTGNTGNEGNTGNTGNEGNAGNTGDTGNTGNTGNEGNTGNTGNAGNTGNTDNKDNTNNSSSSTKKPTSIPQAGSNVVNYIIFGLVAVLVVSAGVWMVKSRKK